MLNELQLERKYIQIINLFSDGAIFVYITICHRIGIYYKRGEKKCGAKNSLLLNHYKMNSYFQCKLNHSRFISSVLFHIPTPPEKKEPAMISILIKKSFRFVDPDSIYTLIHLCLLNAYVSLHNIFINVTYIVCSRSMMGAYSIFPARLKPHPLPGVRIHTHNLIKSFYEFQRW